MPNDELSTILDGLAHVTPETPEETRLADKLAKLRAEEASRPECEKPHFFGFENRDMEREVVANVVHAPQTFGRLVPHLLPDLFDTAEGHLLMALVQNHYEEEGVPPPPAALLYDISHLRHNSNEDISIYQSLKEWIGHKPDARTRTKILKTVVADIRKKAYRNAAYRMADLAEAGDTAGMHAALEFASTAGVAPANVLVLHEAAHVLRPEAIENIGVGIQRLDMDMHNGGAAPGEVVLWMATTGSGKTTVMLNCAVHAYRQGRDVLYFVLEGGNQDIARRAISIMSEVPTRDLPNHQELAHRSVVSVFNDKHSQFVLMQQDGRRVTAHDIRHQIEDFAKSRDFNPRMIVVDYAELMESTRKDTEAEYLRQCAIMEELKLLASATNAVVVTATQANRTAEGVATIDLKHAAGSYNKAHPVDYVISINATPDEEQAGQVRFHLAKNRHGPEHRQVVCGINRASGKLYQET